MKPQQKQKEPYYREKICEKVKPKNCQNKLRITTKEIEITFFHQQHNFTQNNTQFFTVN